MRPHPLHALGSSPRGLARAPRRLARAAFVLMVASAAPIAACATQGEAQVTPPVDLGMTQGLAPVYDDGETQIFQVNVPVALPMRKPTDQEASALGAAAPYPRMPFLLADDVSIVIRYTISNLDDADHTVEVLLDPWNEFAHYKPGLVVSDEETTPDLSGYDKFFKVAGKSRLEGTITADDTHELAVDLATVESVLASPPAGMEVDAERSLINHIFNIQNRSNGDDPQTRGLVPATVAGLTGFDLGLRADSPGDVAIEITLDVTDLRGDRVVPAGRQDAVLGKGEAELTPPG
jgi:hypothetical protein